MDMKPLVGKFNSPIYYLPPPRPEEVETICLRFYDGKSDEGPIDRMMR